MPNVQTDLLDFYQMTTTEAIAVEQPKDEKLAPAMGCGTGEWTT